MDDILSLIIRAAALTFFTIVKIFAKVLAYKLIELLKRQKDRTAPTRHRDGSEKTNQR